MEWICELQYALNVLHEIISAIILFLDLYSLQVNIWLFNVLSANTGVLLQGRAHIFHYPVSCLSKISTYVLKLNSQARVTVQK